MQQIMSEQQKPAARAGEKAGAKSKTPAQSPQWADGLRNIYDSVVNEPLPDDMLALLASLDDAAGAESDKK